MTTVEFFYYGFKDGNNIYIYSIYIDKLIEIGNVLGIKLLDVLVFSRVIVINGVKFRKRGIFYVTKDQNVHKLLDYVTQVLN